MVSGPQIQHHLWISQMKTGRMRKITLFFHNKTRDRKHLQTKKSGNINNHKLSAYFFALFVFFRGGCGMRREWVEFRLIYLLMVRSLGENESTTSDCLPAWHHRRLCNVCQHVMQNSFTSYKEICILHHNTFCTTIRTMKNDAKRAKRWSTKATTKPHRNTHKGTKRQTQFIMNKMLLACLSPSLPFFL